MFPRQYEKVPIRQVRDYLKKSLARIEKEGWKPHDHFLITWPFFGERTDYVFDVDNLAKAIVYRVLHAKTKNPVIDLSSWLHYSPNRTQAEVEEVLREAIRRTYFEPLRRVLMYIAWRIDRGL